MFWQDGDGATLISSALGVVTNNSCQNLSAKLTWSKRTTFAAEFVYGLFIENQTAARH
jgi:hypothetical protein